MKNSIPSDDSDFNETHVLHESGSGCAPPNNQVNRGADSLSPENLQETIFDPANSTEVQMPRGEAEDLSKSHPSVSKLSNHSFEQDSNCSTPPGSSRNLDGDTANVAATCDFGATGSSSVHPSGWQRAAANTVRSGVAAEDHIIVPESVGEYEIKRVLGSGGMGIVYLARHTRLNRDVALKMILTGVHASKSQRSRFEAEAKAVAQLQHPNIVQVFDVGEHEGLPFYSLEFVDGQSLDKRLGGKPLPPREAAELTITICRAMNYAHQRGILHRDLKPANILLTTEGLPKITDFGLAKQLEDQNSLSTEAGTIMGTPSYMSPEQALGLVEQLTPASDQYSLGAMLYELLTGRPPFLGTKAYDTISQVVHKEPVPPCQLQAQLPIDIDTICLKSLQKAPEKRYANCDELADELQRFLRGEPILARPVSKFERALRWCKRNPGIAIPSGIATALVIATAIISSWSWAQISAQAAIIIQERDNVRDERDNVEKQRQKAVQNEEKAQREREEADRLRILANEAKLQAEKNQQLAEQQAMTALNNIQFIVTDIDERLKKQPGMSQLRIDLLQVVEKKWEEIDVALTGGIRGQAIPTLMAVRAKIAEAWVSLEKLKEADAQYQALFKQSEQRIIDKRRNDGSRLNAARILLMWSPVRQRLTGDPSEAEGLREKSIAYVREILKNPNPELIQGTNKPDPKSPNFQQVTAILDSALQGSASAQLKLGELAKAMERYLETEQINLKLLDDIKQDAPWFQATPDSRKKVLSQLISYSVDVGRAGQGNVLMRQGRPEEAISIYKKVVENQRAIYEIDPRDANLRDQLAQQYRNFGIYMLRAGYAQEAEPLLVQSHNLTQQNYEFDPSIGPFKQAFGYSLYYLAVACDEIGRRTEAISLFERSRSLRQEMVDHMDDKDNKINLMLSEARLGNQEAGLKLVDELSAIEAKNPDLRIDLARALAQLSKQIDDAKQKEDLNTRAITSLAQAVADGLVDPYAITSEVDLKPLRADKRFEEIVSKLRIKQ